MKDERRNFGIFDLCTLAALIAVGIGLYVIPLQSKGFYFDDHFSIETNNAIKTINIPSLFNAFNTRFLVGLSFAINYQFCGLHPAGYRLINLLIHCLNAFLVYLLVKSTFSPGGRGPYAAIFASFLFLCHPIETEPVNFITQRFVLLGSFFYLLTLFLYIQFRIRSHPGFFISSMLSALAAMFCKEFVVTLPLMLVLVDIYFFDSKTETFWKRFSCLAPFFIIALIVPILLLKTPTGTLGVADIASSSSHRDITRARDSIGRKQYFLTEINVVCTYLRLLILPLHQDFDYDYPLTKGMNAKTVFCGLFLLFLLGLAWWTYRTSRIVSFCILWFFIALSIESSFIPIGHVIAEYRVYLASVGFIILLTTLIYARKVDVRISNILAAFILASVCVLTCQRNKIWRDEISLWNDTIQKSPHKARAYYNRGLIYQSQGHFDEAFADYTKAIILNPSYADAYDNRGVVLYNQGQLANALRDYNKAIEIDPMNAQAHYNRAIEFLNKGWFIQAIADDNKAIVLNPNYPEAYVNRGVNYYKQGHFKQALSDYQRAIDINPQYAMAYYNKGLCLSSQGQLTEALSDYNKAIEINPNYAQAYDNRAAIYFRQGQYTQALTNEDIALEIDPRFAEAYVDRGISYDHQGDLAAAIADYTKALEINPQLARAHKFLGLVYFKQGHNTQALGEYTQAISLDAQDADAYNDRGSLYGNEGDLRRALADFNKALSLNPHEVDAYNNRQTALKQMNGEK